MFGSGHRRYSPRFLLPQYPDDLSFREPARLHVHPLRGDGLYPFLEELPGLTSVSNFVRTPPINERMF
jgi:hypothetical protein